MAYNDLENLVGVECQGLDLGTRVISGMYTSCKVSVFKQMEKL